MEEDLVAIYYLIMFHKSPRWQEAQKALAPRELAKYVMEYTKAIARGNQWCSAQEQAIHDACMEKAKSL